MVSSIVAISGPSGSGKTWLARNLAAQIADSYPDLDIAIVPEDAYYRDQEHMGFAERLKVNYDHPQALEHELLEQHLRELRSGKRVEIPVYDYVNHTRARRVRPVHPASLTLVEGVLLLTEPRLRKQFDLSLYLDTPIDLCLSRRIARDVQERGRTEQSVREQFEETVLPMYHRFVAPAQGHADKVIAGQSLDAEAVEDLLRTLMELPGPKSLLEARA